MQKLLILIALFFASACSIETENSQFVLHLPTGIVQYERTAPEGYSGVDTIHVFPDTILIVSGGNDNMYFVFQAGKGSDISGIFFVYEHGGMYSVPLEVLDPMGILNININVIEFDAHELSQIVSVWVHEGDTYFVRIDQLLPDGNVKEAFVTEYLGVPWDGDPPLEISDNNLFLHYMLDDGSGHERAKIVYKDGGIKIKKLRL
jgi:hypothetical protein